MDFNSLLEPVISFFSDGIGAVIAKVAEVFYALLWPSNADAATTVVTAPSDAAATAAASK